jgi:hypothetical protein
MAPSEWTISVRAWHQFNGSHCISPSEHRFPISSRSVGLLFKTITLALWPTVTQRRNGFIGYACASGLECNRWCCENLSLRSIYLHAICNSLFTNYTGLHSDGWCCDNLSLRSFHLRVKYNSLLTNYTHHSKSPDLCGYWLSIACSVHLLAYY